MKVGVVIPVGPGRVENLTEVIACLERQTIKPEYLVLLHDGEDAYEGSLTGNSIPSLQVIVPKHQPGMEQPRNIGVKYMETRCDATHVWFLDSDIIFEEDCLEQFIMGHEAADEDRILVGPYEWLGQAEGRVPYPELKNDPRWPSFDRYDPGVVLREDIGAGLACFSGNLIWPIDRFIEIGGFWADIHHGRCEDGELGLRATALGVPISFVRLARGYHMWHLVNMELAMERNARDVPMLNARHPWVQGEGLQVVPKDGRRFDCKCGNCGQVFNTLEMWHHYEDCGRIEGVAS